MYCFQYSPGKVVFANQAKFQPDLSVRTVCRHHKSSTIKVIFTRFICKVTLRPWLHYKANTTPDAIAMSAQNRSRNHIRLHLNSPIQAILPLTWSCPQHPHMQPPSRHKRQRCCLNTAKELERPSKIPQSVGLVFYHKRF